MATRTELVDFFFDTFPEQFKGDRTYWYEARGEEDKDFIAAFQRVFNEMEAEDRKVAADYLFANASDEFKGDVNYWYEDRGEENLDFVNAFGRTFSSSTNEPGDTDPANGPDGSTPLLGGVMAGGSLTKITRAGQDDLWAMTYSYAGVQHVYTFASFDDMEDSLGVGAWGSGTYNNLTLDESVLDGDNNTWLLGDADLFVGQTGTYQAYFADIMREAGLEAGSRNPGWAGRYASDPRIQQIIAEGTAGNWSDERIQAEIRLTPFYQTMYPGIDAFLQSGSPNPEDDWHNYMAQVTEGLGALGYAKDSDGTYRSLMGDMLGQQISIAEFAEFVPTFVRAEQSPEFASALNKWTEQDLGLSIGFEEWFDVLSGSTTPEMQAVVEKATLQFTADATSTNLSDAQISRLANLTDVSEQQMTIAFNSAEEALLSVGQADLARYGLSEEALVSAMFGISSTGGDPLSSGGEFSASEIRKRARKAATELGIQDDSDSKANFFVGFDSFGSPRRQGLTASAPEAG